MIWNIYACMLPLFMFNYYIYMLIPFHAIKYRNWANVEINEIRRVSAPALISKSASHSHTHTHTQTFIHTYTYTRLFSTQCYSNSDDALVLFHQEACERRRIRRKRRRRRRLMVKSALAVARWSEIEGERKKTQEKDTSVLYICVCVRGGESFYFTRICLPS